jgi:hypothetical protein
MHRVAGATIFAVLITTGPALADFYNGNELLDLCREPKGTPKNVICAGYVAAIYSVMTSDSVRGRRHCGPAEGVSVGQIQDVAVRYLERHPNLRHHGATGIVAQAMSEDFPCR